MKVENCRPQEPGECHRRRPVKPPAPSCPRHAAQWNAMTKPRCNSRTPRHRPDIICRSGIKPNHHGSYGCCVARFGRVCADRRLRVGLSVPGKRPNIPLLHPRCKPRPTADDLRHSRCFWAIGANDRKQIYVSAANFLRRTRGRRFRNNRQKRCRTNRPVEEMTGTMKRRLLPSRFPGNAACWWQPPPLHQWVATAKRIWHDSGFGGALTFVSIVSSGHHPYPQR